MVHTRSYKKPTVFQAFLPILAMVLFLGIGYVWYGLPAEPLIILSTILAGIQVRLLGYEYNAILGAISQKIAQTAPALLILICVGLLIGTWMSSGTIPLLIWYGLRLIDPTWLYVTALLVTSVVSLCTGTSWGSAGTIGVAFMGVAHGMDANIAATAGAVVAGAYFGDKFSPLSDTTNLAALAARVDLYEHIYHLRYTTFPSLILSVIVMAVYGYQSHLEGGEIPEKVIEITNSLEQHFRLNVILLLPVGIVLLGSVLKKPTIPVMLFSSGVAMIIALSLQGMSLESVVTSAVNGFKVSMLGNDSVAVGPALERLLQRGGMNSMMGTLLICFCALSFAGTLSLSGALEVIVNSLLRLVRSTASLILVTIGAGITMIGVTCNGQISLLIPIEMLRTAYIERGLHPKNLSRTAEDAATIIEPIMPWTAAGAYMAGTLGVATFSYLPWAVLCWSGIIFASLWGFTGIGITRLTPEEKETLLQREQTRSSAASL